MNQTDDEQIAVLYNSCFGGWEPSIHARELYNARMQDIDPEFVPIYYDEMKRHDPILVEIYQELGEEFDNESYSKTKITYIEKKYENYYHISDNDGNEKVIINETKYELDEMKNKLKTILTSGMTNDEKITELEKHFYAK